MNPDFAFDDDELRTTMWIPKEQLVDDISVSDTMTLFLPCTAQTDEFNLQHKITSTEDRIERILNRRRAQKVCFDGSFMNHSFYFFFFH